ncbi:MAG: S8 family serine peptidase [Syntrophaceae bacterium]|nr:S8 family serine peptidase [Syntrophaceae bacterium]
MTSLDLLAQIPLLKNLSCEDQEGLAKLLRVQKVKKGEALFRKGSEGTTLYIILKGAIKIVLPSRLGDERIVTIFAEGDFAGYDEFDPTDQDADPFDPDGHGTHVAGIIAARGNNDQGIAGVCWNVKVMVLKVQADNSGYMEGFDIIEAIDYAIDKGARIVNCSFGGDSYDQNEVDAFDDLRNNNILSVCAAGNKGSDADYWYIDPADSSKEILTGGRVNAQCALCSIDTIPGDLSCNGRIELDDAIIALQIISGLNPDICSYCIPLGLDINSNGRIGVEEAIYVMQEVAGIGR